MLSEADLSAALWDRSVCVTGGAGFIGSHLCDALVAHGARVSVLDDLSNGLESNLSDVRDRVRFVRGSVLDAGDVRAAVGDADIVFHLAAIASVPRSVAEPARYVEVNAMGTLHVLEAARVAAARVIYAASSSAYGDQPGWPRVETMTPDTRSPYAAAKCAGEYLVRTYARCYDLPAISLRYFNIFGPRQRADSAYAAVIPRWVDAMLSGAAPVVYGDGAQTRDFTYVANAVRANLLAAAVDRPLTGEVVNVACGGRTTLLQLVQAIAELLGVEPACAFVEPRAGEVQHSSASIDRVRALLGYEPVVSFEDGLAETVGYYRGRARDVKNP